MLVFNEYFGSYAQRQLVADHISYNKDVYWSYWREFQQIRLKNKEEFGGIVELLAFSNIIDVWIELWCDVKDSWIRHLQTLSLIEKKINVHFHQWLLISIFIIIASTKIQQIRWHQEKFYLITKNKEMIEKVIINTEKSMNIFIKKLITMLEILY